MISSRHQGRLRDAPSGETVRPAIAIAALLAIFAVLAVIGRVKPVVLPLIYFFDQDAPVLCAMFAGAILFSYLRFGAAWQRPLYPARSSALGLALLILIACWAGHSLVMQGYDLSRDESMASLAASQILSGTLATPVPVEWQPYGHAMLPIFFNGRIPPELVWTSGYLPVNSFFLALGDLVGVPALINPLFLVIGLAAIWSVARRIWPDRHDAAIVVVLLAATSSQLVVTAMTTYAMTGHFALNMVWLALFLRGGKRGIMGALLVGFLATGLHQLHFHPLFVAPFLLWLAWHRKWAPLAAYGVGYLLIALFWWKLYPDLLVSLSGVVDESVPKMDIWTYVEARLSRLFDFSPLLWPMNMARFAAWQNMLLIPLVIGAIPWLRTGQGRENGPILPLFGACALGLALMVYQGHGWGYRYLHGAIGGFCLLAGYGWCRLVPGAGPSRAWAMLKYSCCFTLLLVLPAQLVMAHSFVAPYARLYQAIQNAPADVVLVDVRDGFYVQDVVQNSPDFSRRAKIIDLTLIPLAELGSLCRTNRILLVDRRHYRAFGMRGQPVGPGLERALGERRELLARLHCAPPLKMPGD